MNEKQILDYLEALKSYITGTITRREFDIYKRSLGVIDGRMNAK